MLQICYSGNLEYSGKVKCLQIKELPTVSLALELTLHFLSQATVPSVSDLSQQADASFCQKRIYI